MKVPPKRKGNLDDFFFLDVTVPVPSMKVPPKRKGNSGEDFVQVTTEDPQ